MTPLETPFEYLRNRPRDFSVVESEILNGCAGAAVTYTEYFVGGSLVLPDLDALVEVSDDTFSDADDWVDALNESSESRARALAKLPIHSTASTLWRYAIDATWTPALGFKPNELMHGVRMFCIVARYSSEVLSVGAIQVPTTLEQVYARAYARLLVDFARNPRIDETEACDDWLRIEDVALLAEIAPQSVRNAMNATGDQRLESIQTAAGTRIDPAKAHQWLMGRRRYVPTDLQQLDQYVESHREGQA